MKVLKLSFEMTSHREKRACQSHDWINIELHSIILKYHIKL